MLERKAITEQTVKTWSNLAAERASRGNWVDDDNHEPFLLMTCEALESFLLPLLYDVGLKSQLEGIYPVENIMKDVQSAVEYSKPGFFMHPEYYERGFLDIKDKSKWPQNLDVASYAFSTMVHFKHLFSDELSAAEKPFLAGIDDLIVRALQFIAKCKVKDPEGPTGWSWGENATYSFLYFTHSAIEACREVFGAKFGEMISAKIPKKERDTLQELRLNLTEARTWVEKSHLDPENEEKFMVNKKIKIPEDDSESYYYNLYALLILLETGSTHEYIPDAVYFLVNGFVTDDSIQKSVEFAFPFVLEGDKESGFGLKRSAVYSDRSFIPGLLKMIGLFLEYKPEFKPRYEEYIDYIIKSLNNRRFEDTYLWWDDGFRIYSTERVVEAFGSTLDYLQTEEVKTAELGPALTFNIAQESVYKLKELLGIERLEKELSELKAKMANPTLEGPGLIAGMEDMVQYEEEATSLFNSGDYAGCREKCKKALQEFQNDPIALKIFTDLIKQCDQVQ